MFTLNHSSPLIYDTPVYFSDFVVLKNKFFIIMVDKDIFFFNLETGKKIKRFQIVVDNSCLMDIKKWDCTENDEFILIVNNNIILFKLIEENTSKINLNISNYAYFPELDIKDNEEFILKGFKKINSQKNRFYIYNNKHNDILIY